MTNPAAMKPAVPAAGGSLAGLSGASLASMATLHGGAGLLNAAGQNQFAGQLGGALGGQNALAASRRARRLHIGNLPQGVGLDAQMLKQFFNAALVSASLHDTSKEGDPVLDTMIAGEGSADAPRTQRTVAPHTPHAPLLPLQASLGSSSSAQSPRRSRASRSTASSSAASSCGSSGRATTRRCPTRCMRN